MKNKLLESMVITLTLLSFFIVKNNVHADENMSPNFTVRANLPENQAEDVTGYFHISMDSDQSQLITVEVTNRTAEDITVIPSLATATTNSNGVINYRRNDNEIDESLIVNFEDISILSEQVIELIPFETKQVSILIEIPETDFEGQILGGISFEEETSDRDKESAAMVVNRFSYNIAVMIELGEEMPENELQLNEVRATQRSGFNFIEANLQNVAGKMISTLDVEASIYKSDDETPVYTSNKTGLKMAPNSNFNYGIDLQKTPFQRGDYTIRMWITADDKTYEFERNFSITVEDATNLNESAVLIEIPNNNSWIYILLTFVGTLALGISFIIYIKKNRIKQ